MKKCLIHYHDEIRIVNIGMNADGIPADPVERCNRSAHALRAVLGKSLYMRTGFESYIRQQQCRSFGTLSASSMPPDFECVVHD
jgi:hypothetical protein